MIAASCILFDLDGTLVDTAPDMVGALNELRAGEDLPPVAYERLRSYVSHGALGLLNAGMPAHGSEGRLQARTERFLEIYRERVCRESRLFAGLEAILNEIEARGWRWGVVTNKPAYLSEPLLAALELTERLAALVCGDTLSEKKPHPAPLRYACDLSGVSPAAAVYIGDDRRDIAAGRAAGCATVAAAYGYLVPGDEPGNWGADIVVNSVPEIATVLGLSSAPIS